MRKLARILAGLLILVVLLALPAAWLAIACRGEAQSAAGTPVLSDEVRAAIKETPHYRRDEQRTYLTYPEWYIVYVSRDYAAFIQERMPSDFGYGQAIAGFWSGYCSVNRIILGRYPFNFAEQLAVYVIGVSHTIEFALKGLYENTLGRLSEALAPAEPTAEDRFARDFAKDYAASLDLVPWYEYPFGQRLGDLWSEVPMSGPGLIRKWERRFALSSELAAKTAYAWMIGGGTAAAYGVERPETLAVLAGAAALAPELAAEVKAEQKLSDGSALVSIRRYQPFTDAVRKLARADVRFLDVAGNDEMLVTVILPPGAQLPAMQALLEAPVLSGSGDRRVGFSVPVDGLLETVRAVEASGGQFEHAYDY